MHFDNCVVYCDWQHLSPLDLPRLTFKYSENIYFKNRRIYDIRRMQLCIIILLTSVICKTCVFIWELPHILKWFYCFNSMYWSIIACLSFEWTLSRNQFNLCLFTLNILGIRWISCDHTCTWDTRSRESRVTCDNVTRVTPKLTFPHYMATIVRCGNFIFHSFFTAWEIDKIFTHNQLTRK